MPGWTDTIILYCQSALRAAHRHCRHIVGPRRGVLWCVVAALMPPDSVVIIGDSVADSVVRRRLSRRPAADQSSTTRRLGFCASYEKIKYRAINTYVRYVPTIRDLAVVKLAPIQSKGILVGNPSPSKAISTQQSATSIIQNHAITSQRKGTVKQLTARRGNHTLFVQLILRERRRIS